MAKPAIKRYISDLHIGHNRILEFSPERGGICVDSHTEWLIEQWNSVVLNRDITYILGDVVFGDDNFKHLDRLNGRKIVILGNHDKVKRLVDYVEIEAPIKKRLDKDGCTAWLSHHPIHNMELSGCLNIHGHLHGKIVTDGENKKDNRYINCCVEHCNGIPKTWEEWKVIHDIR